MRYVTKMVEVVLTFGFYFMLLNCTHLIFSQLEVFVLIKKKKREKKVAFMECLLFFKFKEAFLG